MRVLTTSLSPEEQHLVCIAKEARARAQAPYSNYYVGVAVMATNWFIYAGMNVERANYTSTPHAAQVAIDSMVAHIGPVGIRAVAIVKASRAENPNAPAWFCGHCRGIIWENCLGQKEVRIITVVSETEVEVATIGELYPKKFGRKIWV